MSEDCVAVCESSALKDGGPGVRFSLREGDEEAIGFAIRFRGRVHGYVNRCAHVPIELDWNPGDFFSSDGNYLMCATHGALYAPDTGQCRGGPCRGKRLRPLLMREADGHVYWLPEGDFRAPGA